MRNIFCDLSFFFAMQREPNVPFSASEWKKRINELKGDPRAQEIKVLENYGKTGFDTLRELAETSGLYL